MRFVRFTHGAQNFRDFTFREWLLTRKKRKNKYLAKINNHTVLHTSECRVAKSLVVLFPGRKFKCLEMRLSLVGGHIAIVKFRKT